MKKLITAIVAAAAMFTFTGCDDVPSKEVVTAASYAIGTSSGLVVKLLNIDEDTKAVICNVIGVVAEVTPGENQSFEEAWTPVATKYIDELIASGKLPDALNKNPELTRSVLIKASEIMFKGLDRLFEKHPDWKTYPDVVVGAISGFVNGFKATLGCTDCVDCTIKTPRAEVEAEAKIISERCKVPYPAK